mmetsp:Transcript_62347/g.161752  ORF Transcript_62347/g.161752 Transcript_62347/m.161752 type:complete len:109 (-) Transcript_62347:98-424(-)|eukprot:CAMPEP_0115358928 /NCGR_PEP_ID=MMETSP0270-20121206/100911_1 /TAXON_ID=71861 /ORGANISM="Scrippsiella trochoidea, Strain CCMP3099" /LENGTH=108 /DNA_ID=CAMNT_0002781421 /DNA_START=301 /DNA_END=627 /DNA_ORIENTATION=+
MCTSVVTSGQPCAGGGAACDALGRAVQVSAAGIHNLHTSTCEGAVSSKTLSHTRFGYAATLSQSARIERWPVQGAWGIVVSGQRMVLCSRIAFTAMYEQLWQMIGLRM